MTIRPGPVKKRSTRSAREESRLASTPAKLDRESAVEGAEVEVRTAHVKAAAGKV